jgi:hypothetical protein
LICVGSPIFRCFKGVTLRLGYKEYRPVLYSALGHRVARFIPGALRKVNDSESECVRPSHAGIPLCRQVSITERAVGHWEVGLLASDEEPVLRL